MAADITQYILTAAVALGSAIGSALTVLKVQGRRNGNGFKNLATKLELSQALREMEGAAMKGRHDLRGQIERMVAAAALDLKGVESNLAQCILVVQQKVQALEVKLAAMEALIRKGRPGG